MTRTAEITRTTGETDVRLALALDGAARFASGLNVRHFRRRMAEVRLNDAAPALARAGVPIARAEGFERHAASMVLRQNPRP